MPPKKTPVDIDRAHQLIAEARRHQAEREKTYRAQALRMYPWVCARW